MRVYIDLWAPMMHGYFKMGNAFCHIIFDASLFMYKIRVRHIHGMSYPCPILALKVGPTGQAVPCLGAA